MTLREMVSLTGLSESELNNYYADGLIGKKKDGGACFGAQDAKDVGLIRTLKGFGMSSEEIRQYFSLMHQNHAEKAAALLRAFRAKLLREIHEGQTSLDTLDCIIRITEHTV